MRDGDPFFWGGGRGFSLSQTIKKKKKKVTLHKNEEKIKIQPRYSQSLLPHLASACSGYATEEILEECANGPQPSRTILEDRVIT